MTTAQDMLRSYAERMERLLDEIDGLKADLKEIEAECKGNGLNVQAVKRLIAIKRKDKAKADQQLELLSDMILYAPHVGVDFSAVKAAGETAQDDEEPRRASAAKVEEPAGDRVSEIAAGLIRHAAAGDGMAHAVIEAAKEGPDAMVAVAGVLLPAAETRATSVHPERVGAEELGRRARRDGKSIDACPYAMSDDGTRRSLWRTGWRTEERLLEAGVPA